MFFIPVQKRVVRKRIIKKGGKQVKKGPIQRKVPVKRFIPPSTGQLPFRPMPIPKDFKNKDVEKQVKGGFSNFLSSTL